MGINKKSKRSTYRKKKRVRTMKKTIYKRRHINKTKKRKGGDNDDLEMGSELITPYMKAVPPDPERFSKYEEQIKTDSFAPKPAADVESVFSGPTPEGKQAIERNKMMDEDPLYKEPFETEDLRIFSSNSGGRKKRASRHRKK